jgi:hypothetical protein
MATMRDGIGCNARWRPRSQLKAQTDDVGDGTDRPAAAEVYQSGAVRGIESRGNATDTLARCEDVAKIL